MIDVSLWMLIGLPGSGKSTWARCLVQGRSPLLLISTDQIRAELYGDEAIQGNWADIWQQVQRRLAQGVAAVQAGTLAGVVYDATNTQRRKRREFVRLARSLGFTRIVAVWFDVPLVICRQRNGERSRQVPLAVIETMSRQLSDVPPHWAEGFDAVVRLR